MNSYILVAIGALAATICEALFRWHQGSYYQVFPLALLLAIITNYGVFRTMQGASSLIEGLIVWTVMTSILRVVFTLLLLREVPALNQWLAFGLVVVAGMVSKLWKIGG